MTYDSRVITTDAAALAAYSALFVPTLGAVEADYLRWLYADNPRGAVVGFDAFAGSDLAAHYATIPVAGLVDGVPAKGLLSLNTATHPSHQGKGLFTRLAEETYAHAAANGYDFVVGVANANSTPGFTRKLGFQLVTPLDVLVGAGSCAASTERVGFSMAWDEPALRWRMKRPRAKYFATKEGAVLAHTQKAGILAYMTHAPASVAGELPRPPLIAPLRMWIGIDPKLTKRGVLAPLPDKLKPSPLNLIFRDLTGRGRQLSRDTTRFTLLDFDAY